MGRLVAAGFTALVFAATGACGSSGGASPGSTGDAGNPSASGSSSGGREGGIGSIIDSGGLAEGGGGSLGGLDGSSGGGSSGAPGGGDSGSDPFAGCTWTIGSGTPQAPAPTQDNSADLGTAVFGIDAFDATQRRRVVPVNVTSPLPGITLSQAYVTRLTTADETAYITIAATNSGMEYPCFVQATTSQWLDSNGQVLNPGGNGPYLSGSVGALSDMLSTDSCLAPGETGYFIDLAIAGNAPIYSAIASIQIGLQSLATGTTPPGKLLPSRYEVGTCAGNRTMRVTGTASGGTVSVGPGANLAPAIFLDGAGLPVGWALLIEELSVNVAAGSVAYFADGQDEPAVARARVFLPFQPPDPTLMSVTLPGYVLRAMQDLQRDRIDRAGRAQVARQLAHRVAP